MNMTACVGVMSSLRTHYGLLTPNRPIISSGWARPVIKRLHLFASRQDNEVHYSAGVHHVDTI